MSKFSDKCKELLTESGYNIYRLSQTASLERTTLQRMVTGKRLPGQQFVENFCRALRISLLQEKEVMELYKIECMGETAYLNQKTIMELFQNLSEFEKKSYEIHRNIIDHGDLELLSSISDHTYDTEMFLQFILKQAFQQEETPVIYTNIPGNSTLLSHYLMLLVPQYQKDISVKHLIYFQTSVSSAHENLETLNQILPLCFSKSINYEPYYFYSKLSKTDQPNLLFPFYIITDQYALQLSGNLQKGLLHSEPDFVREYTNEFERCLNQSFPLIQQSDTLDEAIRLYLECNVTPKIVESIEPALCDLDLISPQQFTNLVHKHIPEYLHLLDSYNDFLDALYHSKRKAFSTEAGLRRFCEKGISSGTSSLIFPPFDRDERIRSLNHCVSNFDLGGEKHLLNHHFSFPNSLHIELRDRSELNIIHIVDQKNISFITILESSICDAFAEFFELLTDSEYVFPDEQFKDILKKQLGNLEHQKLSDSKVLPPPRQIKPSDLCHLKEAVGK